MSNYFPFIKEFKLNSLWEDLEIFPIFYFKIYNPFKKFSFLFNFKYLLHLTENPPLKGLRNSLMTERNSFPNLRLTNMDARERKERLDERMARFMQLMTFFGHVDNFLTQKTSGFLKVMGKAVGADDYEEDYEPRYRSVKRVPPRIKTIISS